MGPLPSWVLYEHRMAYHTTLGNAMIAVIGDTPIVPVCVSSSREMGLYDHVRIEDGCEIDLPGFDGDPSAIDWQTKTFRPPAMEVYKITMDGRLFEEEAHHESVPEEDRSLYDEELGGFEEDWHKARGMMRKVHEGWSDIEYHGILEFHARVDDESYAYKAKFTDGDLVDVWHYERFGSR